MVKILIAPDKFKGSLTAAEVCDAANEFFSSTGKFSVSMLPLADGGEGTFEILMHHFDGRTHETIVHDPLMRKISASYGLSGDGKTAFIEMAKTSGLQLLKSEERNPLLATTFGMGELIARALEKNVKTLVLGIGGSATNDAGTGMASALGYRFLDEDGAVLHPMNGETLARIARIDSSQVSPRLREVNIIALCDVKNSFTGATGAARVFAAQKGASPSTVEVLENGMISLETLLMSDYQFSTNFSGAGAAGGLGAGASFFLRARLQAGMDFLSEITSLERKISESDIVITGEGKLDSQSLSGKVVQRVASMAKKYSKKVIAVCGILELDPSQLRDLGIDECLILSRDKGVENAINNAFPLIKTRLSESAVLARHNIIQ